MPPGRSPVIYVIAGPNGAGKTTFAREFLPHEGIGEFLNADLLAAGLRWINAGGVILKPDIYERIQEQVRSTQTR